MAQTIAAFGGLQKRARHQDPRLGYFLGTREYRCATPSFPAGAALRIEVTLRYLDDSGISAFDCRIHLDGAEVASATLKTFEEP
jgi:predicted hotdog family 3-hydroxylacyl-ACP dehydratase